MAIKESISMESVRQYNMCTCIPHSQFQTNNTKQTIILHLHVWLWKNRSVWMELVWQCYWGYMYNIVYQLSQTYIFTSFGVFYWRNYYAYQLDLQYFKCTSTFDTSKRPGHTCAPHVHSNPSLTPPPPPPPTFKIRAYTCMADISVDFKLVLNHG